MRRLRSLASTNNWILFADLFAGLLLFLLLSLVHLPRPPGPNIHIKFTRELADAINTATAITAAIRKGLEATLPQDAPELTWGETQISIPSGALFASFRYDDFLSTEQKRAFLSALRTAVHKALDGVEPPRRRIVRVIIEGHSDSDPIRLWAVTPAIPTNWELSARRATGVLRFFEEGGLESRSYNIIAVGLADTVPVASNDTEKGKAENRRIVIRISPDIEAIRATLPGVRR